MSAVYRAERAHPGIRHAPVQRASIVQAPRQGDILGAPPAKDVTFLHERRAAQRAGGRIDVFA
jgi:hypothetical protein